METAGPVSAPASPVIEGRRSEPHEHGETLMNDFSEKAKEIAYSESRRLLDRTPGRSACTSALGHAARRGRVVVPESAIRIPIYLRGGKGARVWDVDGNEYVDTHGGFGCMIVGHAHPKIVEAITRASSSGTHFAAPTEDTVLFAEELCRRFGLEKVRFANSGTEATMSAIRVARAATGRDDIVKIEGSYHGHHDPVMFSVVPNADLMGGREQPASTPMSLGVPKYLEGHTHAVPFNDLVVLERLLDGTRRRDRVPDHRTGDDEHRHRRTRARVSRRA